MITFEEIEGKPCPNYAEKIKNFYQSMFPDADLEKFNYRIDSAKKLFTVVAFANDGIVGFKLGYWLDSTKFYSWVGGVKPEFRKQGIANELMKRQHSWCKRNGFQIVQTKTKNSFKPMLILNIKNGFDIVALQPDEQGEIKIVLEKNLSK